MTAKRRMLRERINPTERLAVLRALQQNALGKDTAAALAIGREIRQLEATQKGRR